MLRDLTILLKNEPRIGRRVSRSSYAPHFNGARSPKKIPRGKSFERPRAAAMTLRRTDVAS